MNYTELYKKDLLRAQISCIDYNLLQDAKILITGAGGLVCSNLVDYLLCINDSFGLKMRIYGAVRNVEKMEKRFAWLLHRKDLRIIEYDALKHIEWDTEVDYIIHGASPAFPKMYVQQPAETMKVNLIGTINILEYAKNHHVKAVLFLSSSEIYGKNSLSKPYSEADYGYVDLLQPRSCYPSAKRACETLCITYLEEYGVCSIIVRPGHVFGPTATRLDNRISSSFFYDTLEGKNIVLKSPGTQLRSYCYAPDCSSAIITVLTKGKAGEAYNIANPLSNISIREFSEILARVAGRKIIFENPETTEKRGFNAMDNACLDPGKLQQLGWAPQFDAETGIKHTYCIMKNEC